MKLLYAFFLIAIMTLNVAASVVDLLQGSESFELKESKGENSDNDLDLKKSFESNLYFHVFHTEFGFRKSKRSKKNCFTEDYFLLSELHVKQPERPPEC